MISSTDQARALGSTAVAPHEAGATASTTRTRLQAVLGKQHFVVDPKTMAEPVQQLFDAVPRNAHFETLRPILARLPRALDIKSRRDDAHHDGGDGYDESDDNDQHDDNSEDGEYTRDETVLYTRSRLPVLDSASVELWRTLHDFRPITSDYASGYVIDAPHPLPTSPSDLSCPMLSSASAASLARLEAAFNWADLTLRAETERVWYGVLFLSIRKRGSESISFYEADRRAHEEATRSGGLIMYWYGAPDPSTGANLATCIWTSRHAALVASRLPLHKSAAHYAAPSYQRYDLVRYKLVKRPAETHLRIQAWTKDDDRQHVV